MTRELDIYFQERLAGHLLLDRKHRFVFRYAEEWLKSPFAIPLSLSLPLTEKPYEDDAARPFFSNLLPEADIRQAVARKVGISEHNDFAMLEAIGGECAGAVSILPTGVQPSDKGTYRPVDDKELHAIVATLPGRPFLVGEEGLRLSLAGAQNKLPIYVEKGRISLPLGSLPSSHILKPPIRDLSGTVENEAFCMMLAGRAGLPVPTVSIYRGTDTLYIVERYDRVRDDKGRLVRIHQEDFCQALGIPPDRKYESEGGPSLNDCFTLLMKHSVRPAADMKKMIMWVIFNYLTGNADAHAKNLALLLTEEGPALAPFYDLLCTGAYKDLTTRLAMKIGGENRPAWVRLRHWEGMAREIGIKPGMVIEMLSQMAGRIVADAEKLALEFKSAHGSADVIDAILALIRERVHKVAVLEGK